jgi:uncharacterized membrane protein
MMWLILILSFVLRLIGINQSMWLDEAISVTMAQLPIDKIVSVFSSHDFHPPMFYWVLHIWIKIFGNEVIVMRLSSILFSLITIWLVYKIGKEIKNKKLGLWAALFVGVNPLLIYYSQELRMYSMTAMLLTGAFYFFVKLNKKNNWKNILGFGVLTGLSFITFYGSIFLTGAMILYFLINKKWKLFWLSSIGITIAVLAVSPLLLTQLKMSGQMLNQVTNWSLVLGKVNLKNLLLIPFKFVIGRINWYPKISYYLFGGAWTTIVFCLATKQLIKNKMMRWVLIMPIVMGIIFSFKSPLMQYFRFLYLIPIISLVLAEIKNIKIKIFLMVGFLTFSGMYLLNPNMYREDWKSLTASLKDENKVYMVESFGDPVRYYNSKIEIVDIKMVDPAEKKITVIPYGEVIHGVDSHKKMEGLGYKLIKQNNFREIITEDWEK